jgi:eukaryotic-like serine/threonine-protein kinase
VFYVMPFVDGESLRDLLTREKQLPVDVALRIAHEVAGALDYAHRHGVIHRDIKPENILLHDGRAVVADFGIALAASRSDGSTRLTETGMSLGTPHYMSPEQAMGERTLDARTDVYALGCVLYEMLAGEPPFTGPTAQAIVARVLTSAPLPLVETRKTVPVHVDAAVHTALEKLPADRFASAADFARALDDPAFRATSTSVRPREVLVATGARRPGIVPWTVAGVATLAAVALAFMPAREPMAESAATFASLGLEDVGILGLGSNSFSISNDGRHVALVVDRPGNVGLAVRSLDSLGVRYVPRTRSANYPFWSPDGKSLGFFADDSLRIIDIGTGAGRALCQALDPRGGAWSAEGVILFSTGTGVRQTTAAGRDCDRSPIRKPMIETRGRPYFFPDGRHFIVTSDMRVWLGEVGGDSLVVLTDLVLAEAVLAPPDLLLRKAPSTSRLQAQRIDLSRRQLVGEPIDIIDGVPNPGGQTAVAASANGVLVAYVRRRPLRDSASTAVVAADGPRIVEIDRSTGRVTQRRAPESTWGGLRTAHDGRRFALGGWHIRTGEFSSATRDVRVSGSVESGRQTKSSPIWAPADSAIAYLRGGKVELVNLRSGAARPLFELPPGTRRPQLRDWSADGQRIAYVRGTDQGGATEAWEYDARTDSSRRMFEESASVGEIRYAPGKFSAEWIAYQLTAGGETDVFIRPLGNGTPVRISAGGGRWPRWRGDGGELYYVDADGAVIAVPVRLGTVPVVGTPSTIVAATALGSLRATEFDISPDGTRFQFNTATKVEELTLVLNWWALLGGSR